MNATLLVVIGKTTKREVTLQLPTVLGRSREADVTVAHPLISRRHCEISEDNGLLILRDLTSLNGTMIGGRRVEFAALLPDAEFTIGPVTFRVCYEYDGDLTAVPETRFLDAAPEQAEAGLGGPHSAGAEEEPMLAGHEAMSAGLSGESVSGDLALPDLMALADADPEELLPSLLAPPTPTVQPVPAAAIGPVGPQWPPVAHDQYPTQPTTSALEDPMDVDSSLQSGGHAKDSPWATELQALEKLRHSPSAPAPRQPPVQPEPAVIAPSAEPIAPPVATPAQESNASDEFDPEFGSFLAGLE